MSDHKGNPNPEGRNFAGDPCPVCGDEVAQSLPHHLRFECGGTQPQRETSQLDGDVRDRLLAELDTHHPGAPDLRWGAAINAVAVIVTLTQRYPTVVTAETLRLETDLSEGQVRRAIVMGREAGLIAAQRDLDDGRVWTYTLTRRGARLTGVFATPDERGGEADV